MVRLIWAQVCFVQCIKKMIMISSNYRGISLLCTTYKILSDIIFKRFTQYVDPKIGGYQCGFWKGKSSKDQIFTPRQILEMTREFGITTHHLFIDFKEAHFESINRIVWYESVAEFQIPPKLVRLAVAGMSSTTCRIQFLGTLSE